MEFIDPLLTEYAEDHSSSEPGLLSKLNRETHERILMPRMLSGHLQGRFLSIISHLVRPQSILEIGTYTGYSALCLAEGLESGGLLQTIDINDELETMVTSYIAKSGYGDRIRLLYGDAIKIIPTLDGPFDIVFIDADKINYSAYYEMVFGKVRPGGLIIADNVLWSGKVLGPAKSDKDTAAIIAFNDMVKNDSRVEKVLLPVRDGLTLIRKK
jgi:predicted O-methyltransferase YrrM